MSENCKKCGKAPQPNPVPFPVKRNRHGYAAPSWNLPKVKKIYAFREPGTEAFVYVGQTQQALRNRLHSHLYSNSNNIPRLRAWFDLVKAKGTEPEMVLLEELNYGCDVFIHESLWILELTAKGHLLINCFGYGIDCRGAGVRKKRSKPMPAKSIKYSSKYRTSKLKEYVRSRIQAAYRPTTAESLE